MGIQDVRNAFLEAGKGRLRVTDCHLHTIADGNNSQRLVVNGFDMNGGSFELDSGPFDPKTNPNEQARAMAEKFLNIPKASS